MHFKRKSKDYKSQKAFLSEQVSSILKFDTPPMLKDHGVPTTQCFISNRNIERALLDVGPSVNLIPHSVYLELGLGELEPLNCTLLLADRLVRTIRGWIDDILVQIDKCFFFLLILLYWTWILDMLQSKSLLF